jgi:pyruvate formate lyase activating enzyme
MGSQQYIHPAKWWGKLEDGRIKCLLCPRGCVISENSLGFCAVRKNVEGKLYSLAYGRPVALQVDPIEKKPLAEFMPRTTTFSLGTFGCNLNCSFCQNSSLSRGSYGPAEMARYVHPEEIVQMALKYRCKSVAFTYNEPAIFAEYAIDIAKLAHDNSLATVLVSNGYITRQAAKDLYPHIDAANIDMKGFSEEFYTTMTGSHLQPVLDAIKLIYDLGKHVEITNLVIPGKNDSMEMIDLWLDWVEENLDTAVPLHFSAFFPAYKYHDSPPTPRETLFGIRKHAHERGFKSVYLGNI